MAFLPLPRFFSFSPNVCSPSSWFLSLPQTSTPSRPSHSELLISFPRLSSHSRKLPSLPYSPLLFLDLPHTHTPSLSQTFLPFSLNCISASTSVSFSQTRPASFPNLPALCQSSALLPPSSHLFSNLLLFFSFLILYVFLLSPVSHSIFSLLLLLSLSIVSPFIHSTHFSLTITPFSNVHFSCLYPPSYSSGPHDFPVPLTILTPFPRLPRPSLPFPSPYFHAPSAGACGYLYEPPATVFGLMTPFR